MAADERTATPAEAESEAQRRLDRLLAAIDADQPVAIHTHDHPDPDSIASAYALALLLSRRRNVETALVYGGTIGRAMNRAMVDLLGIPLSRASEIDREAFGSHCLIDTQPRTGNHSLPDDVPIAIAIDHHPLRSETKRVGFADVRTDFGATSTIMYYYLKAAGLDLPTKLATALLLGIKSDTRGLERGSSEADLAAHLEIFPRADLVLLSRIESPRIPRRYFAAFHQALERSTVYGDAVVADLGDVESPDLIAELADFLTPLEQVDHALVTGLHEERLYLSLRSREEGGDAGALIATIVGSLGTAGGHGRMAGGQIDVEGDPGPVIDEVTNRFLRALGWPRDRAGVPLVDER